MSPADMGGALRTALGSMRSLGSLLTEEPLERCPTH